MEPRKINESLGKTVEFYDPKVKRKLTGTLDFDEEFGVYFLRFDKLDKYRPIIGMKGCEDSNFIVDGKIKTLLELTKYWDRYDEVITFEMDGDRCAICERDFDKGDRLTTFNTKTGKILREGDYNCLE